jgi:hypothetical protein
MAEPTRGTWQIHQGIVTRWNAAGLDATFRREWRDPNNTQYLVLHDTQANETPPGPYCVYEVGLPIVIGHSTGRADASVHTEIQTQSITAQFRVHAADTGNESGKKIAIRLATAIASAFDNQFLDFGYDKHIMTEKGIDFGTFEDDNEYVWAIPYIWLVDAALNRTVRRNVEI